MAWVWLGVVLSVVVLTWRDYGITWDEAWHLEYGDHILAWFSSLGTDRSALSYRLDYLYGGGFDLLGAIVRRLSPLPPYETMHLLGAILGVLGLAGAWRLGRRLAGPWAGLASLVLLTTTPVYYGHMFNNPKDLPFAVGYVWGLHELVAFVQDFPRLERARWVRLAIVLGLAASVRVGGVVLLGMFILAAVALVTLRSVRAMGSLDAVLLTRKVLLPIGLTVAGAWAVMLVAWPWAQLAPLARPWQALSEMAKFSAHERVMSFAGEAMRTTDPRWDYLLHYLGLKLPLAVLGLAVVGALLGLHGLLRSPRPNSTTVIAGSTVAAAIVIPPAYAALAGSVLYDGLRHFLFVVPPLCAVAGAGLVELIRLHGRSLPLLVGAAVLAVAVSTVSVAAAMVELHPHQYVYFNRLAGGLAGATGRYDTDYYGNSYKEAFEGLADLLWQRDPESFTRSEFIVSACMPRRVSELYLPPNFRLKKPGRTGVKPADFYIGYTREDCHLEHRNAPIVFEVQRRGAVLAVVRDLRALRGPTTSGETRP